MIKRTIIENGYEVLINNTTKVRVYNVIGESTVIEFLEKMGENAWYISSSKDKTERFKRLVNQYEEYLVDPRGITLIEE